MKRIKSDQRGQVFAFTAISMVALLGMSAFVLDVGAWFRADRQIQSVADAAALAGAQKLPDDPGAAIALAKDYATRNGGPAPTSVTVTKTKGTNDTIVVEMNAQTPGVLSGVFGVEAVDIGAHAAARAALPGKVRWVAPIVVNEKHPMLNCGTGDFGRPKPCAGPGNPATLDYYHLKVGGGGKTAPDGAGSFGFVDFTGEGNGTNDLKQQMEDGYNEYIEPGNFSARTGNPFSAISGEIDQHIAAGDELLFPIYRKIVGSGTNAQFEIIGFAAFVITSVDFTGSNEKIYGYFTGNVSWDAIEAESGTPTDFGIRAIILSE
jgi:hypothetical protein